MTGLEILAPIVGSFAKMFIEKSMKELSKDEKFNQLKNAIRESIVREIRFNKSMIEEIRKSSKEEQIKRTIASLETLHFEAVNASGVPIRLIFDRSGVDKQFLRECYDKFKPHPKTPLFLGWSRSIKNEAELVENLYFRLKIVKALSDLEIPKRKESYIYILFLCFVYGKKFQYIPDPLANNNQPIRVM